MLSVAEPFYLWFRIGKESFVYKNFPLFPAPSLLLLSFIICGESVCNRNRTEANIENQKSAAFLFNFSFCMFLKEGREKASRISDGDHSESTIYAAIRHQPRPKPEDVMYVNIQPSPKVSFLQEPPGAHIPHGLWNMLPLSSRTQLHSLKLKREEQAHWKKAAQSLQLIDGTLLNWA